MEEAIPAQVGIRQNRGFVLGSLSFGHGISHLYDLGFPLILREIAAVFGYSNFTVAILFSVRQAGSSVVNLGGGPLVDMLKDKWGLILTACMAWSALTFIIMGASPNFGVLVLAVLLISVPGSLWHLPAAAALSQRFPDRRGFAITIHGTVANICNYLGPLLAAVLLTVLLWRYVLFIYAIPAALMAVFVWWSLRDVGSPDGEKEEAKQLMPQLRHSLTAVKNPVVMALVLAATLRGIGLSAVAHWTPFYLIGVEDDMGVIDAASSLGMGKIEAGLHLGLLAGMGVISGPILGPLSDKIGRKAIMVPGFIVAGALSLLVVKTGDSRLLLLVFAGMGLFSFALHHILQASVLDIVGRGAEATAIGLVFGLGGLVGIATPFLASELIIKHWGGYGAIYYYSGILTLIPAVIVLFTPLRPKAPAESAPA